MISNLIADGVIVVAGGGGGVPVIEDGPRLVGVEGVVDKDLAAAILATEVNATTLLILTDVPAVQRGFGTDHAEDLHELSAADARSLLDAGEFGAGSMGPKVWAAVDFVERGAGRTAVIAELDDASSALTGGAGTTIR